MYKATVNAEETSKSHTGLAERPERYNNHTKYFRRKKYEKETEVSKYIWSLKKENFTINREVVKTSNTKMRQSEMCKLCVEERLEIV